MAAVKGSDTTPFGSASCQLRIRIGDEFPECSADRNAASCYFDAVSSSSPAGWAIFR
ncbi:unnamed protein product [Rhodiola kirilowii]